MQMRSRFAVIIFLIAGSAFAARPLETDDAGTVDPGFVEVELSADYQDDPGSESWETPIGIKTGILPGLDVGLGFGWQRLREGGAAESVWVTAEILAEGEHEDGAGTVLLDNVGTRWVFSDNLARDAAAGSALNGGDAPDLFLTVGLTWLFGL